MCTHYEFNEARGVETKECLSCKHAQIIPDGDGNITVKCPHIPEYYKDHPYDRA